MSKLNYIIGLFIFICNFASSQTVYVDVNPDSCICVTSSINTYDTLKTYWDLDHDGTDDFILKSIAWFYDGTHHNEFTVITPLNKNKVAGDSLCQNCAYAFKLDSGDVINNLSLWLSTSSLFVNFTLFQGWHGYWHMPADTFKYVGLKFYSGSTLYYGWIRLNAYTDNGSAKILITEYAYNTSGITAGTGLTTTIYKNESIRPTSSIYPNPSNGSFRLNMKENQNGELIILDAFGKKIYSQNLFRGENIIIISSLAKGIYTYKTIQEDKQFSVGKIIIE